jgi:hypothetical protein
MFLLLDIDGVMVQAAPWKKVDIHPDGFFEFLPQAVISLNHILIETGASIVLTTSHKSSYSLNEWDEFFQNRGIVAKLDKLDDTTHLVSRKDEILNWLSKTGHQKNFVIIDDDHSLHDLPSELKEKVVFTQSLIGLTHEKAINAIQILKETP